jgi:hypothetical protein
VCLGAASLAQALLQAQVEPTGFWLVTRDSQPVGPAEPLSGVLQSALWGLGKVIGLEHPELQPRSIDLSQDEDVQTQATRLRAELAPPGRGTPDRPAFRCPLCGETAALRLNNVLPRSWPCPQVPTVWTAPSVGCSTRCSCGRWSGVPPAAGEVEIEVQASSLNFRDVLNALGAYPGDAGALGGECAGMVVGVGPDVTEFAVGDQVLAVAAGSLSSHVTTSVRFVAPLPSGLTLAEAAALPAVFLTAIYGLHHLARIQRGQRVLIHAAAGGVGLAAVQIAQAAGAEVYATASPAKWDVLRAFGVQHIYHSRTTDFSAQILADTDGAGVDILLNSLTGPAFMQANLAVLAQGGIWQK